VPDRLTGAAGPYGGRTLILLNPLAGQEDQARLRRRIGGAFAERDAPFDLVTTEYSGHTTVLAREAVKLGYRAVAACGGDGTLAEAATGLAGSHVPLAVIPRGTGNQVARNLGIPLRLTDAIDVAVHGRATPIDLGLIGDRAFALAAGAGFDAAVMGSATREMKEKWGFGAYVYAAMREALNAAPRRFRIVADDREFEVDAVSVMVANVGELFASWLPLRLPLTPREPGAESAWNDGMLDVVIVAPRKPQDVAALLWQAAQRKLTSSDRLLLFQAQQYPHRGGPGDRGAGGWRPGGHHARVHDRHARRRPRHRAGLTAAVHEHPRIQHITADDGVSLALHRIGPATGTPVILAAGTFSNWSFWLGTRGTGFARLLAAEGLRGVRAGLPRARRQPAAGAGAALDVRRLGPPRRARRRPGHCGGRPPSAAGRPFRRRRISAGRAGRGGDVRDAVPAALVAATPLPWLQHWRRTAAWTMRLASRHLRRFPARLLRLGPEDELPGVMEQWMDWNLKGHWVGDDGTDYAAAFAALHTPLLVMAGAGDHRFAPPHAIEALYDLVGADTKEFVLAGRDSGFSRDYNHVDLIVSRAARTEIWPLMLAWLGRYRAYA
jgi:diacylglycerol kinase (ATP)